MNKTAWTATAKAIKVISNKRCRKDMLLQQKYKKPADLILHTDLESLVCGRKGNGFSHLPFPPGHRSRMSYCMMI